MGEGPEFIKTIEESSPDDLIRRLMECEACAARREGLINMLRQVGDASKDEWRTLRHVVGQMLWSVAFQQGLKP